MKQHGKRARQESAIKRLENTVTMHEANAELTVAIMAPMIISTNKRIHEIGMGIFFVGFIYTILKYHIFVAEY